MIVPSSAFVLFLTSLNTTIGEAWSTTPSEYQRYSQTLPMSTLDMAFGWTGMIPKPRIWNGPRVTYEQAPQMYTVRALPYELTMKMDRFRFNDDTHGIYYRLLPDMARQFKRTPDIWFRDLLTNSGTQTTGNGGLPPQFGLDGLTAFNTAHPVNLYNQTATGPGTYSNDLTGGGQTIGGILTGGSFGTTAFATAIEYMGTYKAEDGESMGVEPTLLMVPNALRLEADLVLKSTFFGSPSWGTITGMVGTSDNPIKKWGIEMMVNKLLDVQSKTRWYLFDTSKAFMPLIWCEREPATMVQRTNPTDPVNFDEHMLIWGGEGRAVPAWGPSWLFLRSGP